MMKLSRTEERLQKIKDVNTLLYEVSEVFNDIQCILEAYCCGNCEECDMEHLCEHKEE